MTSEAKSPEPNPIATMMSALKNLPAAAASPKAEQPMSFNGNFEQWFAKDEYIPRPKLVELEDNKDKMDTNRQNFMKKLKRQEQAQQQKDKEQDQTNNKNVKPVGSKGAGGGASTGAGGGGNVSIKKGQNTEGSKKKGGSSADNLAISLEKLWIEVNWLKRNKLDVAEFMRLRKGAGVVNGSIDIQEQNDAAA